MAVTPSNVRRLPGTADDPASTAPSSPVLASPAADPCRGNFDDRAHIEYAMRRLMTAAADAEAYLGLMPDWQVQARVLQRALVWELAQCKAALEVWGTKP